MKAIYPPSSRSTSSVGCAPLPSGLPEEVGHEQTALYEMTGAPSQAHAHALATDQPIFIPASIFVDDRGWSIMNQLQGVMGPEGQINYSIQRPGVIKAWHRHRQQTDFWLCLNGHLKIAVFRESDNQLWTIISGERRPGVVIIPPTLWHGATAVGQEPAGLLYYVTHAYDAEFPDEERRAWDSVKGFSWGVQNR